MKAHEALIAWNRGDDVEGDGYKLGDICCRSPYGRRHESENSARAER
jgi:hypothetical protein